MPCRRVLGADASGLDCALQEVQYGAPSPLRSPALRMSEVHVAPPDRVEQHCGHLRWVVERPEGAVEFSVPQDSLDGLHEHEVRLMLSAVVDVEG